jgi:guanylate cyclase
MIERIGIVESDSSDERVRKTVLVAFAILVGSAAVVWGVIYVLFDEPLAGSIPLMYAVGSFSSVAVFGFTKRFPWFRRTQLLLILLLPFALMEVLGGFVLGSGVITWALLCPLGALMFAERKQAVWWLLTYGLLLLVSGVLEFSADDENHLPTAVINAFFVMNVLGPSLVAFFMLQYFSNQKDSAMALLSDEQAKSESLLLNVLPAEIAEELKTSDRTIAQHHDAVSVLFADVVGSTSLTVEYEPTRMVEMLNVVFSYFDTLTDKYGLEKIRTIGDNYMVASGVPKSRDDHAVALANMALDMNAYVTQNPAGATPLKFRIGMNTGSVVAGVIGQQKFHYDIWGDSVNTASRMESHGEPGKIQITREMYEALGNGFVCVPRGVVDIKGKGEMETWWLEGRISGNSG